MNTGAQAAMHDLRFPKALVWAVILVCVAPILLMLLGVDFGS